MDDMDDIEDFQRELNADAESLNETEKTPPEDPTNEDTNSEEENSNDDDNGDNGETPVPDEDDEVVDSPGESHAYGPSGKGKAKDQKPSKDGKPGRTSPEVKKIKKDDKETDIMKAIWAEIVSFYESCLDETMNFSLGFLGWVLVERDEKSPKPKEPKDEEIEKTPADYGREIYAKYQDYSEKFLSTFTKAHQELKDNVEKEEAGIPPKWDTWEGKPVFYENFKNIVARARADANSPEAKIMKRFNRAPAIEEELQNKKLDVLSIAIGVAVADEVRNPTKIKLPSEVSKAVKDIEMWLSDTKMTNEALKERVHERLTRIPPLEGDSELITGLNRKLRELDLITRRNEPVNALLKEKIRETKELASPLAKMERASVEYYEKILKNIGKIRVAYSSDPEKRATMVSEYGEHCKAIFEKNKKNNSIDNFMLDGQPIGDLPEPEIKIRRPLETPAKPDIFKLVAQRLQRRA